MDITIEKVKEEECTIEIDLESKEIKEIIEFSPAIKNMLVNEFKPEISDELYSILKFLSLDKKKLGGLYDIKSDYLIYQSVLMTGNYELIKSIKDPDLRLKAFSSGLKNWSWSKILGNFMEQDYKFLGIYLDENNQTLLGYLISILYFSKAIKLLDLYEKNECDLIKPGNIDNNGDTELLICLKAKGAMNQQRGKKKELIKKLIRLSDNLNHFDKNERNLLYYLFSYQEFCEIREMFCGQNTYDILVEMLKKIGEFERVYHYKYNHGPLLYLLCESNCVSFDDTREKLIEFLLENENININYKRFFHDDDGSTAFSMIVQGCHKMKILNQFLDYERNGEKIDVNEKYEKGYLIVKFLTRLREKEWLYMKLLDRGLDIFHIDSDGNNVLMYALRDNLPRVVMRLIEMGSKIDIVNKNGSTALKYLSMFSTDRKLALDIGRIIINNYLVNNPELIGKEDKNPFEIDNFKYTPLMEAICRRLFELANEILNYKECNVGYYYKGKCALSCAIDINNKDLALRIAKMRMEPFDCNPYVDYESNPKIDEYHTATNNLVLDAMNKEMSDVAIEILKHLKMSIELKPKVYKELYRKFSRESDVSSKELFAFLNSQQSSYCSIC